MVVEASANAELIDRFYTAFARRDHEAMAGCYTADATFTDPVFQDLRGDEVRAMWRMLCERGADLELSHSAIETEGDRGSAHWVADYTFSGTGRAVHNEIDAGFRFEDGLIAEHRDSLRPLALGAPGAWAGRRPARLVAAGAGEDPQPGACQPGRVQALARCQRRGSSPSSSTSSPRISR